MRYFYCMLPRKKRQPLSLAILVTFCYVNHEKTDFCEVNYANQRVSDRKI